MPGGAISVWPDRPKLLLVWPYLANFAAMGLARATQVTGDATYATHAWDYLRWYSSVERPGTGYVTDYKIVDGTELESTGTYDSTDAYAGTFLAAAWDTYSATDDVSALKSISSGVSGALSAIASTQQSDGLTWATPSYHVAYLMDNVQALGGLEAAEAIERVLGNSTLESEAASRVADMKSGIASLWDASDDSYSWAKQANGWEHTTNWGNFYPDAMEQVSAVEWGAVPSTKAAEIMGKVAADEPEWTNPNATVNYLDGSSVEREKASYWPSAAVAYNAVGDTSTASSGLSSILSSAAAVGYGWPYTTSDAGEAIVAASGSPLLDSTSPPATTSDSTADTASAPTIKHPVLGRRGLGKAEHKTKTKTKPKRHKAKPLKRSRARRASLSLRLAAFRTRALPRSGKGSQGSDALVAAVAPGGARGGGRLPELASLAALAAATSLGLILAFVKRRRRAAAT